MRVLLTGATGFIGRLLALRLQREGHFVVAWVRDKARAAQLLPPAVALTGPQDGAESLISVVAEVDAVVNLAGEPIFGRRLTRERRREVRNSRIALTRRLTAAIKSAPVPPAVFISASAVGYYGDRGDAVLDESCRPGQGFLADVVRDWEEACEVELPEATRLVVYRLGVVLGPAGGALAAMLPAFSRGLGGTAGTGDQYVSWVHIDDVLSALACALVDGRYSGVYNLCAPRAGTNAELTETLAEVLGRPAFLPVPALALKLLFGGSADALLQSQRCRPRRLLEAGFSFRFPQLAPALCNLLTDGANVQLLRTADPAVDVPSSPYLARRAPRFVLSAETVIQAPLAEVFDFFSQAENLGALTPRDLSFVIHTPRPIALAPGAQIDYTLSIAGIPIAWRTVIETWRPPSLFVDAQHLGPYHSWWHEHRFSALSTETTLMTDRVFYAPPFGVLGEIAQSLVVAPMLTRIFSYRACAIQQRFGSRATPGVEVKAA